MMMTAAGFSATGDEYLLTRGSACAVVGQVAAVLREFSIDGVRYTETYPASSTPPMGCGMVLMPWPNRVAGARWGNDGAHQLDITEPALGNAIHGLLRNRPYTVADRGSDFVTLDATIYPQHGWPYALATSVRYALTEAGLRVTHSVTNIGPGGAVFGCGAHPYLRVGDVPCSELTLRIAARAQLVTNEQKIPTATRQLDDALMGLAEGLTVGDLDLDTGFTDLIGVDAPTEDDAANGFATDRPAAQRFEHTLTAPDGRGVTLWAGRDFGYVQVFTPRNFPGYPGDSATGDPATPRQRQAVAIEPMTCPADALNSGHGLIRLDTGQSWSGSWGITPLSPGAL